MPRKTSWLVCAAALAWAAAFGGPGCASSADREPEPSTMYGLPLVDVQIAPADLHRLQADTLGVVQLTVDLRFEGELQTGVTIELHGGVDPKVPKRSYKLTFLDAAKLRSDILGVAHEKHRRLYLLAAWADPTFLRAWLTFALERALGGLAPRLGHAVLAFNGEFSGLYVVAEAIDSPFLTLHGLDPAGSVFKALSSREANWAPKSDPLYCYDQKEGDQAGGAAELTDLLDALGDPATPLDEQHVRDAIEPRLDLDGFLTWQLAHTLAMDDASYVENYYLYHDPAAVTGTPQARFRVIAWGGDATWGQTASGKSQLATSEHWHGTDRFSPRLLQLPSYQQRYLAAYAQALAGAAAPAGQHALVALLAARVAEAARADLHAWSRDKDYDAEVARLQQAIEDRHATMEHVLQVLGGE